MMPPALDYCVRRATRSITAVEVPSGATGGVPQLPTRFSPPLPPSCGPRRRSLQEAGDSFSGYTLLASESSVAYNLIDTRNAFTTRSLDPAHRDTVLSGLLLHVVRKPSTEMLLAAGGINVQSDSVAQICASAPRFRGLISACTADSGVFGNTTASGTLLGGIGSDPVFSRWGLACPLLVPGCTWGVCPHIIQIVNAICVQVPYLMLYLIV